MCQCYATRSGAPASCSPRERPLPTPRPRPRSVAMPGSAVQARLAAARRLRESWHRSCLLRLVGLRRLGRRARCRTGPRYLVSRPYCGLASHLLLAQQRWQCENEVRARHGRATAMCRRAEPRPQPRSPNPRLLGPRKPPCSPLAFRSSARHSRPAHVRASCCCTLRPSCHRQGLAAASGSKTTDVRDVDACTPDLARHMAG